MTTTGAALQSLLDGLFDAVVHGRWEEADADLETLVQVAMAAIIQDRAADLAMIARLTARAHTALALQHPATDDPDALTMHRLGQLRAVAILVAAGRNRRPARSPQVLTSAEGAAAVLLAALDGGAQTGQALVTMTGLKPEAVASTLPELLAAGLVHAWPAGRLIVYERTGERKHPSS